MTDPGFTTPEMDHLFSATSRVQAMLHVESVLAEAQAEAGLIPAAAAQAIARACAGGIDDPDALLAAGWQAGTPVLPLLAILRERLDEGHRPWLHFEATTQDIVDTALAVQMLPALVRLTDSARHAGRALRSIIERDGEATVMARTFLQPAEPTTVAVRVARWLGPLTEYTHDLTLSAPSAQWAGAIGQRPADSAQSLFGAKLFLQTPAVWHSDRRWIREPVRRISDLATWAGKIARDVILLAQPELGEATTRFGGSSAMPHKRNPIDALRCAAAADACTGVATIVTSARPPEFERGIGGWHAEQFAVPLVFQTAHATLAALVSCLESLEMHAPTSPMLSDADRHAASRFVARTVERFSSTGLAPR